MSRFEGATCDSCCVSVNDTQATGLANVVFSGLKEPKRLDLCQQCADYVAWFIDEGCERDYKIDGKRVGQ